MIGDAQTDSPGMYVKNQSYTVMDYEIGYITATAVLDKWETSLVSSTMELHGLIRCLYDILLSGVSISKLCTNQHMMVCKFFQLIEEEAGHVECIKLRKPGDTVEMSICNALACCNVQIDDDVLN